MQALNLWQPAVELLVIVRKISTTVPSIPETARRGLFFRQLSTLLLLAALLACIWVVTLRVADSGERAALESGLLVAEREADQVALEWEVRLALIKSLQSLARGVSRAAMAGSPEFPERLAEMRTAAALAGRAIVNVSGTDAAGRLVWNIRPGPVEAIDYSDREQIIAIRSRGADQFIAAPMQGKVTGNLIIPFAEAVRRPDGSLEAITLLAIDADIIKLLHRSSGRASVIALARRDGVILARAPENAIGTVLDMRSTIFDRATRSGSASGRIASRVDGVERLYAARVLPNSDVLVAVGLDEAAILAPQRASNDHLMQAATLLTMGAIGVALLMMIGLRMRVVSQARQVQMLQARRDEALLREISEHATDVISLYDGNFGLIFSNEAYFRVTGVRVSDAIGRRFGASAFAEDRPAVESALQALSRDGGARRLEIRMCPLRGGQCWVESEIVALPRDRMSRVEDVHFLAISRDISARKASEQALAEAQKNIRTLLSHDEGVLSKFNFDADGTMQRAEISPLSARHVVGIDTTETDSFVRMSRQIHRGDANLVATARQRCIDVGEATCEYRCLHVDGSLRWRRARYVRVATQGGGFDVSVFSSDITAEHEGRERLEHAERMAMMGELITRIAHEMNQPLAAISIAAETGKLILAKGDGVAAVTTKLNRIIDQTFRIAGFVAHIRGLGASQIGQSMRFSVAHLIEDAEALASLRLHMSGVITSKELAPGLPELDLPFAPLVQALRNIIDNACDAYDTQRSGQGTAQEIHFTAHLAAGRLVLSIRDQAGGIAPEALERLFDPFFTTRTTGVGTGIGLTIARAAITDMGGSIRAANEDGGAVFEISLPVPA